MKKCRPREALESLGGASWAPKWSPREAPGHPETAQMRPQEAQSASKITYRRSMLVLRTRKSLKDVQDVHVRVLEASKIIKKSWKNVYFLKMWLF